MIHSLFGKTFEGPLSLVFSLRCLSVSRWIFSKTRDDILFFASLNLPRELLILDDFGEVVIRFELLRVVNWWSTASAVSIFHFAWFLSPLFFFSFLNFFCFLLIMFNSLGLKRDLISFKYTLCTSFAFFDLVSWLLIFGLWTVVLKCGNCSGTKFSLWWLLAVLVCVRRVLKTVLLNEKYHKTFEQIYFHLCVVVVVTDGVWISSHDRQSSRTWVMWVILACVTRKCPLVHSGSYTLYL